MAATAEQIALAADPSTDAQTLADLAYAQPELWRAIAAHPNAYPGLIDWMRENGLADASVTVPPASETRPTSNTGARRRPPKAALIAAVAGVAVIALALGGWFAYSVSATRHQKPNTVSVQAGQAAHLADATMSIDIPGKAISGSGTLSVAQTTENGRSGWKIGLSGAKLVGDAKITFRHKFAEGEPAPLMSYEGPNGVVPAEHPATVTPSAATVTTRHLSSWFPLWWSDVEKSVGGQLSGLFTPSSAGVSCAGSSGGAQVVAAGLDASQWCAGSDATGNLVVTVANHNGFPVAVETTPGLALSNPDTTLGSTLPPLSAAVTDGPDHPGDSVHLLGGNASYTFTVGGPAAQHLWVRPSPGGYAAQVLLSAAATVQVVTGTRGNESDVYQAIKTAGCASGLRQLAAGDVANASAVAQYLESSLGTVYPCLGKAIVGLPGQDGLTSEAVEPGLVWVLSGTKDAVEAKASTSAIAGQADGQRLSITQPQRYTAVNPSDYQDDSDTAFGSTASLSFDSPSRNIHCGIYDNSDIDPQGSSFGCGLDHYTFTDIPDTTGCSAEITYGGEFKASFDGTVEEPCRGGVEFVGQSQPVKVLAYGTSITYKTITCESDSTGMTCFNTDPDTGFTVSASNFNMW